MIFCVSATGLLLKVTAMAVLLLLMALRGKPMIYLDRPELSFNSNYSFYTELIAPQLWYFQRHKLSDDRCFLLPPV